MINLQRQIAKSLWVAAFNTLARVNIPCVPLGPRVFYGGARAGSLGGPMVKVRLLQQQFPEYLTGFNLVYLLSGALYLSGHTAKTLRRRNMPIVLNQNGVYFKAWYPNGWERENDRLARVLENASHVFYQSEFCKRAADKFLGVSAKSSEILYNGVDTSEFTPAADRPIARRPVRLLLTGKIVHSTAERLYSTIEGLAIARKGGINAILHISGRIDFNVQARAIHMANSLNVAEFIAFNGPYTHQNAPDIYRSADIYVINKHNDACPNVVLEALACGLPVLYSASGGIPELVGDDAGAGMAVAEDFDRVLVPTGDQFAEALNTIIGSYARMRNAARVRAVERFDLKFWLQRHTDVFMKLIQEQR